jgi:hypothetical protein
MLLRNTETLRVAQSKVLFLRNTETLRYAQSKDVPNGTPRVVSEFKGVPEEHLLVACSATQGLLLCATLALGAVRLY